MKVVYQESASDDVVRQFRYYLLTLNLPETALRFRDSVHRTIQELRRHPQIGAHYQSTDPKLESLHAWPITGFEALRIYYAIERDITRIVRVLHSKRDVKSILESK